ncbi:MAG TPA: helix-hairpin-helix domain-containing protein [Nitrososphaeraceae archaeon]|nr:helix-hairpin-helix domain-containing protein [Nitrososphaeraceae archaeon]
MISNAAISRILRQIAYLIELEALDNDKEADKNKSNTVFKIRAYRRTADIIENLSSNVEEVYNKQKLKGLIAIPSVGKAIALKIEEYITTGKIEYAEELKKRTSINVEEFYHLEGVGIGPKTVKALHDSLGLNNLTDVERAAMEGKIRSVPGFSYKKEESILRKIQSFKKDSGRYLLGDVYPLVKQIEVRLSNIKGVKNAIAVGSFRRMKETLGDIDYLVVSDTPEVIMDYFASMPEVDQVVGKGPSKTFVKLNNGMDADLLVVPEESFGSALQYFTGSKEHDVALRKIAISKGLRLNEWGVYDDHNNRLIASSKEEEVYDLLGLEWIPPEMRENKGETELAKKERTKDGQIKLPDLVDYKSLKGDLQVHSSDTDGMMSIKDIALAAKEKFGLEYIVITDHTKNLALAHGLDEDRLLDQANKISELNDKLKNDFEYNNEKERNSGTGSSISNISNNFRILSGAEVNIMKDGSLDIPSNVLDKLDVVGAAIHSNFSQPVEVQTNRLIKASQNPSVDIIFHPTGRIINKRDGYPVNMERLINVAKDTGTILEVDAHYNRLDLKDDHILMAVQNGVKLAIDSDAHHYIHFAFLTFGIGQARRGWAKQSDIVNTLSADKMMNSLK